MNRSNTMSMSRGLVAAWMLGLAVPLAAMDPAPAADLGEQLREAARVGNETLVQQLLDQGADVNAVNSFNETPLHWASFLNCVEVVGLLLERGANVNAADRFGYTPLCLASRKEHAGVVKLLLQRGANVNAVDSSGWTPLHEASRRGYEAVFGLLLQNGADVNIANSSDKTPLHLASEKGHVGLVGLLLEQPGINVNALDTNGYRPLDLALCCGRADIVQLLEGHGAVRGHPLVSAVTYGNEEFVQQLLDQGADVNAANRRGMTPLHEASLRGHEGIVRLLLERGANTNVVDIFGKTPLLIAGHEGIVRLLLARGANTNAADIFGNTPLLIADHEGIIRLLLEHDADINAVNRLGRTALDSALDQGHDGVTQLLQQRGALTGQQLQAQQAQQRNVLGGLVEALITYNQYLDHASLSREAVCPICRDNWSSALLALPCGHVFDQACVEQWLAQHETCPMCRNAVTVEQLQSAIAVAAEQIWNESYGFDYQTSDCNIM